LFLCCRTILFLYAASALERFSFSFSELYITLDTMRAALRHLCQHGAEALTPTKTQSKTVAVGSYIAKYSREVWHRPLISKRVANDLRKQAIRDGTYGSFNATTGMGWEPSWDLVLHSNRYQSPRIGNVQPSKKTARERNRHDRAQKLEENLAGQDQAIEGYYAEKQEAKVQDKSFESIYKRMMRSGGTGGGGR
jgi:hypothetical protein